MLPTQRLCQVCGTHRVLRISQSVHADAGTGESCPFYQPQAAFDTGPALAGDGRCTLAESPTCQKRRKLLKIQQISIPWAKSGAYRYHRNHRRSTTKHGVFRDLCIPSVTGDELSLESWVALLQNCSASFSHKLKIEMYIVDGHSHVAEDLTLLVQVT